MAIGPKRGPQDLLAKLFELRRTKGEKDDFSIYDIEQEGNVGVFAGSDTTAIAMRAIVHHLLTHPKVLQRLQSELDEAYAAGKITTPVAYAGASRLPYLCACVKEAVRLHPSIGLQMPRYVPLGDCEIKGRFFPQGTALGVNAAVSHHDTSIFGSDAAYFNPERWLGRDAATMDRYLLTFGLGARTCTGKNVSLLLQ